MHLAGHLQIVAINGVVPAFDVNRASPTGLPQNSKDIGPIRVAKSRSSVPDNE